MGEGMPYRRGRMGRRKVQEMKKKTKKPAAKKEKPFNVFYAVAKHKEFTKLKHDIAYLNDELRSIRKRMGNTFDRIQNDLALVRRMAQPFDILRRVDGMEQNVNKSYAGVVAVLKNHETTMELMGKIIDKKEDKK